MRYSLLNLSIAGLVVLAACGNSSDDIDALAQGAIVANGISYNGLTFNGISYNGLTFNGLTYNGLTFNGIKYNGISYNGISYNGSSYTTTTTTTTTCTASLSGSQLTVTDSSGRSLTGADLSGIKFSGQLDNGATIPVRIDGVIYDSAIRIYEYAVSLGADNGTWVPLCGTDSSGAAVPAVPIAGNYDSVTGAYTPDDSLFTFACVNAALGKCVVWGYKPWTSSQECKSKSDCKNQSLAEWHAACTRMVRADYCGDGVPHTRNGTIINIWDVFGIQTQATTGWEMEAEWTASGADCIRHTRWVQADLTASSTDLAYVQAHCPNRLAANRNSWECRPDRSDFFTKYGYQDATTSRRLLRNESLNNQ